MRQPVFVTDIANDPNWAQFKDLALAADLRACWSAPIPGHDGAPVGALAPYFRQPLHPLEAARSLTPKCVQLRYLPLLRHDRFPDRQRPRGLAPIPGPANLHPPP